MNVEEQVKAIVAQVSEVEVSEVTNESAIGDFPAWDSMGHLAILNAVEEAFDISFEPEEMMEIELMDKRIEFISNAKDSMVDMDVEGNEIKFFSSEFLIKKYLKLSESDLELNKKLKEKEIKELNLAGNPDEQEELDMQSLSIEDLQRMINEKKFEAKEKIEEKKKNRKGKKQKTENESGENIEKTEEE